VAELLWPDLASDKAAANLRVNLNHLQRALYDEDRDGSTASPIETDRGGLRFGPSVQLDVDRFEQLVADAQRLEREGAPAEAMTRYLEAVALINGPYLDGIDRPWVEATRARWSAVELAVRCRIGELLLAKGEPEQAMKWAVEAGRRTPLDERSGRLLMSCLDAIGDRAGAVASGRRLCQRLADEGLAPQPLTEKLLERLVGH
jgi:DNA-binding SARP family transcriptional activator